MVTVLLLVAGLTHSFKHKEATDFYFSDGVLWLTEGKPDHECVAAYPQGNVVSVEKADCCCHAQGDCSHA